MRNADFEMAIGLSPNRRSAGVDRRGFARNLSHWLCLAAAPAFALMAVLTVLFPSPGMICSMMPDGFSLSGMAPMYLLMSVFHLPPWLKLLAEVPRPSGLRAPFSPGASIRPR